MKEGSSVLNGMRWVLADTGQMRLTALCSSYIYNLGKEHTACHMGVTLGNRVKETQGRWEAGFVVKKERSDPPPPLHYGRM